MNWPSARSRRAPSSQATEKRAPESFAARSKSRMPRSTPRSQWGLGAKSKVGIWPTRLVSRLAASSRPIGTLGSGRLGKVKSRPRSALSVASSPASRDLISSETPFISAFRADASSLAFPRRAISSPHTRCR